MSSIKEKQKSLSERISDIFKPNEIADPEDDPGDVTVAKVSNLIEDDAISEAENNFSDFRKRNAKLLCDQSEKYKGVLASRSDFEEHLTESNSSGDEDNDKNLEHYRNKLQKCQITSDSNESSSGIDDESDNNENKSEDSDEESAYSSSSETEQNQSIDDQTQILVPCTDKNIEIQKGLAVQNQLKVWEKMLEIRINSQKMLIQQNSLPYGNKLNEISKESEEFSTLLSETKSNVSKLLDTFLELQTTLFEQYSETKPLVETFAKKRKYSELEIDDHHETKKYATELEMRNDTIQPYRNQILQKWDEKIRILNPGNTSKNSKSILDNFDIIKKIETALLNKSELIKKSKVIKSNYQLFGQNNIKEQEKSDESIDMEIENDPSLKKEISCEEIYDDTDFYHQQLRELIEFKTNTSMNPGEIAKQFSELQRLRNKMKKKVDTRASKGRKVRYGVHSKLVNFMAPITYSEWTDESKDELYKSLFVT